MSDSPPTRLLLLGTGGYHPTDERQTACLMLPEAGIVLDAGTAFFRVRDHLERDTLDVFLTHAHLDHVVGLTYLLNVVWEKDVRRVTVHGAAEKLAAVEEHLFAPPLFPVRPACTFRPLDGPVDLAAGGRLDSFPLSHPGGSLGYRLDWPDRSMAYVTDTTAEPDAAYLEKIRGVDVLVHECHFTDAHDEFARLTGHSTTTAVAELARAARVRRLVLVHVNPLGSDAGSGADASGDDPVDLAAARAVFPATELGTDGMEVRLG